VTNTLFMVLEHAEKGDLHHEIQKRRSILAVNKHPDGKTLKILKCNWQLFFLRN
jgi:hypothetical protein